MSKTLYLLIAFGMIFLCSCSQTSDTMETATIVGSAKITTPAASATLTGMLSLTDQPTQPPEPTPTTADLLASADSIQINMFRLVPKDFLGAGYTNLMLIRDDPDLKSAFESIPSVSLSLRWQISGSRVDRMISFSRVPDDVATNAIGIVNILHGDFGKATLAGLAQESTMAAPVFVEYQGFELLVEEEGDPFNFAYVILDQSTIIFGEEAGVKAVIDTALGLESAPLSDLGSALPQVLFASVFNHCPQYEDLGCTAMVVPGLAQGSSSAISLLHVYEFGDADSAAGGLEKIQENVDSGMMTQTGTITIVPDRITQEGSFIILDALISVEEIEDVLELESGSSE